MKTLEQQVQRLVQEDVAIVPYDSRWPALFQQEKEHLLSHLPAELIGRIEHFGSTAVPGLSAKPVIDMLVEVTSLEETRRRIVPILTAEGYEYVWRPTACDDTPPFYAWFIKRGSSGVRTHHIHMVENSFTEHWERLLFRDYLITRPDVAEAYQRLKLKLATEHPKDRVAYARGKAAFIDEATEQAKRFFSESHED